jgi:hypothetical protein
MRRGAGVSLVRAYESDTDNLHGGRVMNAHSEWAQVNFGSCQLGDKRRTQRLIQVAAEVANNPSASFPDQMTTWSDLKAAYGLFDREEVTFEAIVRPHWELTKNRTSGRYLIIGDTTEFDFGCHRDVPDLGPTGNGLGWGFLLHNGLMVAADSKQIVGVAGQTIHYRPQKNVATSSKREHSAAKLKRRRESDVWGVVIDQIGPPPNEVEWTHVFDRGGDNFEVYCHLQQQRSGWVVRGSQLERGVLAGPAEEPMKLSKYLPQLELIGTYELSLRARRQQPARTAKLEVRVGSIKMPVPKHKSPWVRELDPEPIAMGVVQVIEVDPSNDSAPIHWVLLTSLPVDTFDQAWMVIDYYEARWLVEVYQPECTSSARLYQLAA